MPVGQTSIHAGTGGSNPCCQGNPADSCKDHLQGATEHHLSRPGRHPLRKSPGLAMSPAWQIRKWQAAKHRWQDMTSCTSCDGMKYPRLRSCRQACRRVLQTCWRQALRRSARLLSTFCSPSLTRCCPANRRRAKSARMSPALTAVLQSFAMFEKALVPLHASGY